MGKRPFGGVATIVFMTLIHWSSVLEPMALVEDAPVQGWKKYASKFEKTDFFFGLKLEANTFAPGSSISIYFLSLHWYRSHCRISKRPTEESLMFLQVRLQKLIGDGVHTERELSLLIPVAF